MTTEYQTQLDNHEERHVLMERVFLQPSIEMAFYEKMNE